MRDAWNLALKRLILPPPASFYWLDCSCSIDAFSGKLVAFREAFARAREQHVKTKSRWIMALVHCSALQSESYTITRSSNTNTGSRDATDGQAVRSKRKWTVEGWSLTPDDCILGRVLAWHPMDELFSW